MSPKKRTFLVSLALVFLARPEAGAIIGGADAASGEFPWIAGVVRKDVVPAPGLVGSGALVGNQWVLTAAHAVRGIKPTSLEVWLGTTSLDPASPRQTRQVLAVFVHPGFSASGGTSVNDVALLLLDRPVTGIAPLSLLENPEDLSVDDPVVVAGWGTSVLGLSRPSLVLQKAPARILDSGTAGTAFGTTLSPSHLAAVDPDGVATPCVGDSGGPLVKSVSGTPRLAGLVSFGTVACDDASKPTVYARITSLAPWIRWYLGLTQRPPWTRVTGRGWGIVPGAAARLYNGTDFGDFRRTGTVKIASFYAVNPGAGMLTIRASRVVGSGFTLVRAPLSQVRSGSSASFQVRFRSPAAKRRYGGHVVLYTNDPARPVFSFRVSARVL